MLSRRLCRNLSSPFGIYRRKTKLDGVGFTAPIHIGGPVARFWESNPKGTYQDKELHEQLEKESWQENKDNLFGLKDGFKELRTEIVKWKDEWQERITDDSAAFVTKGDRDIVWKFDSPKFLETWKSVSDSDHDEGYSRCSISLSPTGKCLFQGIVNTNPPKDGRIKKAGYCGMKCNRIMKSFKRESYLDWSLYTHLIMRVRGDGRSYMINISTAGYFDITWNDMYHYILYTRGGPYWQYVKIPFSKFVFGSKGRVQDLQGAIPLSRVASLNLAAARVDGPFNLEVDWIGVECDPTFKENFAYENYQMPKYIVGV